MVIDHKDSRRVIDAMDISGRSNSSCAGTHGQIPPQDQPLDSALDPRGAVGSCQLSWCAITMLDSLVLACKDTSHRGSGVAQGETDATTGLGVTQFTDGTPKTQKWYTQDATSSWNASPSSSSGP